MDTSARCSWSGVVFIAASVLFTVTVTGTVVKGLREPAVSHHQADTSKIEPTNFQQRRAQALEAARVLHKTLTLSQKVGQLLLLAGPERPAEDLLRAGRVAGILLPVDQKPREKEVYSSIGWLRPFLAARAVPGAHHGAQRGVMQNALAAVVPLSPTDLTEHCGR